VSAEQGARFVSYDADAGTWKFEVEHFSKYGLLDSDEEEEGGEGDAAKRAQQAGSDSDGEAAELGVRRPRGAAFLGRDGEAGGEPAGRGGEAAEEGAEAMQDSKLAAAAAGGAQPA
jgi:nuclear pore complex protein Nup98-Nup96